jgi:hypothetical protein
VAGIQLNSYQINPCLNEAVSFQDMPAELKEVVFQTLDNLALQRGTTVCRDWTVHVLTAAKNKIHAELGGLIGELIQHRLSKLTGEVPEMISNNLRALFKQSNLFQSRNLLELKESEDDLLHIIREQLKNLKESELDQLIEQSDETSRICDILKQAKLYKTLDESKDGNKARMAFVDLLKSGSCLKKIMLFVEAQDPNKIIEHVADGDHEMLNQSEKDAAILTICKHCSGQYEKEFRNTKYLLIFCKLLGNRELARSLLIRGWVNTIRINEYKEAAFIMEQAYSTVTDLARLRGWSISVPRSKAM